MALIVPSGGLVSQVNGTVDNKVYYRGRWGNTVRTWVNPTNTITPERTAVRALFASLMSLFNSLTPDMQDEWNKFASYQVKFNRLAQPYVPTGLQVFLERNMNLAIILAGPALFPPDDEAFSYIQEFRVATCSTIAMQLDGAFSNGSNVAQGNTAAMIYTTDNQNPALVNKTNRYRMTWLLSSPAHMNTNVLPNWITVWGAPAPIIGKRIFFKIVSIDQNTGQASPPAYCSSIVS